MPSTRVVTSCARSSPPIGMSTITPGRGIGPPRVVKIRGLGGRHRRQRLPEIIIFARHHREAVGIFGDGPLLLARDLADDGDGTARGVNPGIEKTAITREKTPAALTLLRRPAVVLQGSRDNFEHGLRRPILDLDDTAAPPHDGADVLLHMSAHHLEGGTERRLADGARDLARARAEQRRQQEQIRHPFHDCHLRCARSPQQSNRRRGRCTREEERSSSVVRWKRVTYIDAFTWLCCVFVVFWCSFTQARVRPRPSPYWETILFCC